MTNQNKNRHVICAEHISSACRAINKPLQSFKTLFSDKNISVLDYSDDTSKETLVEIRFETATLTCLFNQYNICEGAFLFLDELTDILHYIEYCRKTYPYHYILQGWIINNFCIQIDTKNGECNLLVLPMKK